MSTDDAQVKGLEEQVRSLSDELMQCQADKDFVWSLWKRLQVANPDLTQAVSLVVEREKHKAEMKDRRVLEILQFKDYRIQELEQKVGGEQQMTKVNEEKDIMEKDLTALHEQLLNKSQELEQMKTGCKRQDEERQVVRALEEEKEGLTTCCAALRADLEEERRQANSQRDQKVASQARVKELEEQLNNAEQKVLRLHSHNSSLMAELSSKVNQGTAKEEHLLQLRRELAEVQTMYRQSTEHAAEQSHLIKQLEGLNLDTQRVLRNQEEAHTADTTSYQRLYKELSQCYQALISSEAKLRQSHQELGSQLAQKEQQILHLEAQLQQQQQELIQQQQQQQAQQTTPFPTANRQTNLKTAPEEADDPGLMPSSNPDRASTPDSDPRLELELDLELDKRSRKLISCSPVRRQTRSRSLSPGSIVETSQGRREGVERRVLDLEELLQLKVEENEELRRAHDKRRERLGVFQTHYKTVRDQLTELEKSNGVPGGKMQRAEPWQLRQENSDAVWNELTYMKNLTRKLTTEKADMEEELDTLHVQAAMDRATMKELRLSLTNEHKELLYKVEEACQVRSSTSKKSSVSSERMEDRSSFKKIEQLERRMMSLEEETKKLREEKELLLEANEDLVHNCHSLQASLDHLRSQGAVREEAARAQALAQGEKHRSETMAVEAQLAASRKETTKLHYHVLKLRQELGILRAARDFDRNRAAGPLRGGGVASNINSKVKFKTSRLRGPIRQSSHQTVSPNQAISWQGRSSSTTKDEWEDMSADSDTGEIYIDSLNSESSGTKDCRQHSNRKSYRCARLSNTEVSAAEPNRKQPNFLAQDNKQHEPREQGTRGEKRRWRRKRMLVKTQSCSSSSLQQRVESLQRHIDILRSARKDAVLSARELRSANEKITAQLNSLTEKLCSSKQLTQKLTSDLAGTEQQKKVLEMELEQWRQITFPQQNAPPQAPAAPVNAECFCQGRTVPAPAEPPLQALEAEVKQLQAKLKSASAEVTRQVAANKALRGQLLEKDDKLRQLQEKLSHIERDVSTKKQLLEDQHTRLKFLQELEKNHSGQSEALEKKVKTLSEEASNRKAFIESLKRRLSVATTEKSQHQASCKKLKEDLEKKEQRVHTLQVRVGASEQALAALEQAATEQMEGLTQQSSKAIDVVQRRFSQAHSQLEQLHTFIKALAGEMLIDIQEVKHQLTKRRRLRQASAGAAKGSLSAKSMIKAKAIAASILNMSEYDLADIMDPDQESEAGSEGSGDQEWLEHLNRILQQKIPSASQLMEAVRVKMKERKVLTEELATLATPVSENA
ncbi:centlein isoform X2 [Genypterus blacodes]|uniref:centlein isoform X2 n=1 Tax=Genypterus blacodes TaxID=154954 RepID=UPI003F7658D0